MITKKNYQPEIDGLKAIGILSLIFYHANLNIFGKSIFQGGFIGIDIFFIISGYLFTLSILNKISHNNDTSFKYFFENRVRRILPLLLFVILSFIPFAWIYFLPDDFVSYAKSIISSISFTSNFFNYYSGNELSEMKLSTKPFLHTWALSILVQFYVFFAFIIFLVLKHQKKHFTKILFFLVFLNLIFIQLSSSNNSSLFGSNDFFNSYFLQSRVWEILVGSILAFYKFNINEKIIKSSNARILREIFTFIGLILIISSIVNFNDQMPYLSLYLILPITGVSLIILFSSTNNSMTKILSFKLFTGIGSMSFSLYLWYFPVIVFARITEFVQGEILNKIIVGSIIFLLSILTYYFIEKPTSNKSYKFKLIFFGIFTAIIINLIFNFNVLNKNGELRNYPQIVKENTSENPWFLLKDSKGQVCHDNLSLMGCKFNSFSEKKIYIIGDSQMASLMHNLKERVILKDYQFITSTFGGCLYYPGFNRVNVKNNEVFKNCNDDYFNSLKRILSKEKNSIFIFGGRITLHLSNYRFDNKEGGVEGERWSGKYIPTSSLYNDIGSSLKTEILKLAEKNKIILIYPNPEVGWDVKRKIYLQWINRSDKFSNTFDFKNINTSYKVYKDRNKRSFELLDSIKHSNVYRVYPHKLFCDTIIKERCVTHDDKHIFYSDAHHPSIKGAEMINNLIINEIEKIEK